MFDGTINPADLILQPWVPPPDVPRRPAARYPAHYRADGSLIGHMLNAQFRLPARFGGMDNGPIITCQVLNDTGSTIASIYKSDWAQLNVNNIEVTAKTEVTVADGTSREWLTVTYEVRLISYAPNASIYTIGDWMVDRAIIIDDPVGEGSQRLSGDSMRRQLWFLTTPLNGNNVSSFWIQSPTSWRRNLSHLWPVPQDCLTFLALTQSMATLWPSLSPQFL